MLPRICYALRRLDKLQTCTPRLRNLVLLRRVLRVTMPRVATTGSRAVADRGVGGRLALTQRARERNTAGPSTRLDASPCVAEDETARSGSSRLRSRSETTGG
eukprot:884623-Rhodomonas_salina.2